MRATTTTLFAAALLVGACVENTTTRQDPTPDPTPQDGLTLEKNTPEHIAGTYYDADKGLRLGFDSARRGDDIHMVLTGNDGRHLVSIETRGDTYVMSYMGGKLTMTATKDLIATKGSSEDPDSQLDGIETSGELGTLDELLNAPEMAALPWMSRALGEVGITGFDYDSSLPIHQMAKQTAQGLGIQLPPLDTEQKNGYCQAYPNSWNDCYGMCGMGCSCWSWVCGDCCYHGGCARHDSWCRNGQWYYCYNITAVIALFGC